MGTALAGGEDSIVYALLEVGGIFEVFAEEDETGTGTTEGLVTRMARYNEFGRDGLIVETYVVVVTTSQYSNGLFSSCAATRPLVCAISAMSHAPSRVAVFFNSA